MMLSRGEEGRLRLGWNIFSSTKFLTRFMNPLSSMTGGRFLTLYFLLSQFNQASVNIKIRAVSAAVKTIFVEMSGLTWISRRGDRANPIDLSLDACG